MSRKILLVEDEPDTQKTYKDILESEGYEVTLSSTGEAALGMINGYRPDVILLDIMLPGADGVSIARMFSGREDTKNIPIVMVTALKSFSIPTSLGTISGIRRFIYKPCRPKTLLEGIDDVLRFPR